MGGGENKYQELSRCPWTSGVGSASGAEMASREEALIVQILCSEMDYRSLIDPPGRAEPQLRLLSEAFWVSLGLPLNSEHLLCTCPPVLNSHLHSSL